MTTGDMVDLTTQIAILRLSEIYIGSGNYTSAEINTHCADKTVLATELSTNLEKLGDLSEKPFKADSKVDTLKTKHHVFEGKRTTTFEATINGISQAKKDLLEGISKNGTTITMIGVNDDKSQALIMNGLTWTAAWSGEEGGLWTMVLSTEYTGPTTDAFVVKHAIPDAS